MPLGTSLTFTPFYQIRSPKIYLDMLSLQTHLRDYFIPFSLSSFNFSLSSPIFYSFLPKSFLRSSYPISHILSQCHIPLRPPIFLSPHTIPFPPPIFPLPTPISYSCSHIAWPLPPPTPSLSSVQSTCSLQPRWDPAMKTSHSLSLSSFTPRKNDLPNVH